RKRGRGSSNRGLFRETAVMETILMKLLTCALVATFALALASPAAAQRYTAKHNGDVIELADNTAQMVVPVVWSLSDAWRIQVKGHDLVRTTPTLQEFI